MEVFALLRIHMPVRQWILYNRRSNSYAVQATWPRYSINKTNEHLWSLQLICFHHIKLVQLSNKTYLQIVT